MFFKQENFKEELLYKIKTLIVYNPNMDDE